MVAAAERFRQPTEWTKTSPSRPDATLRAPRLLPADTTPVILACALRDLAHFGIVSLHLLGGYDGFELAREGR